VPAETTNSNDLLLRYHFNDTNSGLAAASAVSTRAASSLLEAIRSTSDELTVLYSNGPDDRSVKLALGYVTAATSGC
jgi:hypothetical protein